MKTKAQQLRELRNKIIYNAETQYEIDYDILDKPVSWKDIFMLAGENDSMYNYAIDSLWWLSDIDKESTMKNILVIPFDLSRHPEEQDEEVLEQLSVLLSKKYKL